MTKFLKNLSDEFLELLYPTRCPACDEVLGFEEKRTGFCRSCKGLIRPVGGNVCLKCGKRVNSEKEFCSDCEKKSHSFEQAKAIYEYAGPIKDAMYRFKYGNRRAYGRIFARDASRLYAPWIRAISPSVIVPVPMFKRKRDLRGYNQAEEFGRFLSGEFRIPMSSNLVIRTHETQALKSLGAEERLKTLKGAFKSTKVFRKNVDILMVDDIFTTGATADAVADALKLAGSGRVFCLFVCIGAGDNKGGSNYGSQKL